MQKCKGPLAKLYIMYSRNKSNYAQIHNPETDKSKRIVGTKHM